jgi:hypothetical protein
MPNRLVAGAIAALLLAGVSVGITAPAASASDGSTPVQVSNFLGEALTSRLADLYGPNASGKGVRFDATTAYSATSRVFVFAPDFVDGKATFSTSSPAIAARRINEWVAVVSVQKAPVGVVTVKYSSKTGPQLVNFAPDLTLAAALPRLGATSQLVHDTAHRAWGSLTVDSITPIEAGTTGLSGAASLADYPRPTAKKTDVSKAVGIDPGVAAGALTLALVILVIALAVLVPRRKKEPLA